MAFPCSIIPTSELGVSFSIKKSSQQQQQQYGRTEPIYKPSMIQYELLDETSGIAILSYIYNKMSLFDDNTEILNPLPVYNNRPQTGSINDNFFSVPRTSSSNMRDGYYNHTVEQNTSLIERGKILLSLRPTKDNIKIIDKNFLIKYNMSISILIKECHVPITNLKKAGIVTNFNDLCD